MIQAIDERFFDAHPAVRGILDLFDYLPGVIFFAKDCESRFVAANAAMLAVKKLDDPKKILGHTDLHFHPPVLATAYIAEDREIMESGRPLANQSWFILDQNGRPGWFRSSKTPLHSSDGKVVGIAGVRYAISTPDEKKHQFQNLTAAIQFLEENYTESISATQLAEIAGLSVTQFNRRFSELFRMSPNRFLQSLRIDKARHHLAFTDQSIGEIAIEAGFYDQSHLNRHFTKMTGLTPGQYRTRFRGRTSERSIRRAES